MRFVLIHGGFHGAWCWSRVIPELKALGHEAIAIDLPGHGKRRDEDVTIRGRQQAILEVLQPGDVLVGHSGGGFDISLAADVAPPNTIRHLIYLAAALPIEGRPLIEAAGGVPEVERDGEVVTQLMSDDTGMLRFIRPTARGWMECFDFKSTWDFFYHDCDEATARWAFSQLSPAPTEYVKEKISIPNFWKADLPRSFIRCLQDRAATRHLTTRVPERLGVAPLILDSSHSPFLSQPTATAKCLVEAVHTKQISPLSPSA